MSPDIIGLCVTIGATVFVAIIAIGLTVFLGLRGFTNRVTDKISNVETSIVSELSTINGKLGEIKVKADDIFNMTNIANVSKTTATITRNLTNFGNTRISALPSNENTIYSIEVEKGILDAHLIGRISRITGLDTIELKLFGKKVPVYPVRTNLVRLVVPSTDSKLCTQYMSILLKWLDEEYHNRRLQQIDEFEKDINV